MTTENLNNELDELNQTPTDEGSESEKPDKENEQTEVENAEDNADADDNQNEEQDLEDDSSETSNELSSPNDPKGVQKRIDKAVRQKKEAEEHNKALREQLHKANQELNKYRAAKQEREPELVEPQEDDFGDDWKGYQKAYKAYWTQKFEREQEEQHVALELKKQAEMEASFQVQKQAAAEKYKDFEQVVNAPEAPISPLMARFIKKSSFGAEIAYYLGKEGFALGDKLYDETDPEKVAMAIGKLEARFEKAPAKVKSNAPRPTHQISGGGVAGALTLDRIQKAAESGSPDFHDMYEKMVGRA